MLSYSLRMDRLAQLIERGPVLIDGAMGTELNARGAGAGQCLEELNLAQPALVLGVHRDYIAAGADLLVLETFTALGELEVAVDAAREVAPQMPVLAHMSFDDEANPAQAAAALVRALEHRGVWAVGANCGSGPNAALEVTAQLAAAGARTISVMPNAGLPQRVGGRLLF